MSLFPESYPPKPLAERMRPRSLDQVLGQGKARHLLNAYIDQGEMPSVIFWGPPGSGKTSLSRLMAALLGWEGRTLNATSASVKDIRDLAKEARDLWSQLEKRTLLFIDEIHRLNKAQQDVLLPIVEAGSLIMAGSTTENPYFSITQALRSRVQLVQLSALAPADIEQGLSAACEREEVAMTKDAIEWVAIRSGGDLRLAYTVLESASIIARAQGREITLDDVASCLSQSQLSVGNKADNHYDLASAFQKSLRGSDPNAAIYYLARFLETGEDPRFIARRLLVTASEDVGNADPKALDVASHAFRAVEVIGLPECRIHLAQAALYVARAPKSNEAISALSKATTLLKNRPLDPIPAHLRDAHYKGAEDLGHGKGYVYSHDQPNVAQTFLPESIKDQVFTNDRPGREKVDLASRDWLYDWLKQAFRDEGWFDIDAEKVAQKIQWPVHRVRAAMNQLVSEQKITFKRSFQFPTEEKGDAE